MIIGFVIWSIVAAIPFIVGISTWKSKEPTGFLWVMLGVVVLTISLGVIYIFIEKHYRI